MCNTEPFVEYTENLPFTSTYFCREAEPLWAGLDATRALALRLNQRSEAFQRLGAVQLIKTALACEKRFGRDQWRFVYLWYKVSHDDRTRQECDVLSDEFDRFVELTRGELPLAKMTWQELFLRIEKTAGPDHSLYFSYLRDRYFRNSH